MTTDNKTLAVDVLAVMALDANHAYHWRREGSDTSWAEENSIQSEVARAAVAELIEALDVAAYGEYLPETVEQSIRDALARVKGESA